MTAGNPQNTKIRWNPLRAVFVLVVAAFFGIATFEHLFSVNSHYYFTWIWQWIPSQIVYPILLPLAIPFFIGQMLYLRRPSRLRTALVAIMIFRFALMLGAAAVQKTPPSLARIPEVIRSTLSTGYFAQAAKLIDEGVTVRQYLSRYPTLLGHFYLHARQKPPGLVLIEMGMIHLFGPGEGGAMASGLLIGVGATFAILATYAFIAYFTGNRDAAFFGASYFALCPSPILFFPQFDQCYPIFTVCITVLWAMALKHNQARYSAGLGFAYAIVSTITYASGVLPIFLGGFALLQCLTDRRCGLSRIFRHFLISLAAFVGCEFAFWALVGFNPIATFRACVEQERFIAKFLIDVYHFHHHGLPGTIPTDLYDFALGSGWISFVLVVFYFKSAVKEGLTSEVRIALVCVAQFVLLAISGLLATETARIWIFLMPMLMTPIGLELAKWEPRARMVVYFALLLLTAAMCQSMQFISTGN